MKAISTTTAAVMLAATCYLPVSANADDRTTSAWAGCRVDLGNASGVGPGWRASGGTAVISCPLLKKVAGNNLNYVFARMKRASTSGGDPFCNLNSDSAFDTSSDATWRFASDTTAAQSLSLPLPTTYSTGYLNIVCVLNSNDIFYGIRYGQD